VGQIVAKRTRRSRRRAKHAAASRLLTLAGLLLLGAATVSLFHPWSLAKPAPGSVLATSGPLAARGFQVVASDPAVSSVPGHPYSVIPGGIHSEKQLAEVLAHDPLVAQHYANFDVRKLRFVRLSQGRDAYVSYRLGDMIFWTSKKIPLFAGETLVTDGTHFARSRCGNRVSAVPRQPTSAFQPSDLALAAPIVHLTPASFKLPTTLTNSSINFQPAGTPVDGLGGLPIFPVVYFPPGGGGGGIGPVYPPTGDAPLPTPEPGTLLLFSSGLLLLGLKYLWTLRRA
jgi:hypothetical protein